MGALVDFHARNKLLLMAYNQTRARVLGRIVANPGRERFEPLAARYRGELAAALARPPREQSNVNVLMHALGHVSDHLTRAERAHFLDALDAYRSRRLPLIAVQSVLGSWAARFDVTDLEDQTYFAPFPQELVRLPTADRSGRRARGRAAS